MKEEPTRKSGSGPDRHRGVGVQPPLVEGCTGDVVVGSLLAVQEDAEEDVVGGIRLLDEGGGVRGAAAVSSTTNVAQQAEIRAGDFIARTGERPEAQKVLSLAGGARRVVRGHRNRRGGHLGLEGG